MPKLAPSIEGHVTRMGSVTTRQLCVCVCACMCVCVLACVFMNPSITLHTIPIISIMIYHNNLTK